MKADPDQGRHLRLIHGVPYPPRYAPRHYHEIPWWFGLFWLGAIAFCLGFWYGAYRLVAWLVGW